MNHQCSIAFPHSVSNRGSAFERKKLHENYTCISLDKISYRYIHCLHRHYYSRPFVCAIGHNHGRCQPCFRQQHVFMWLSGLTDTEQTFFSISLLSVTFCADLNACLASSKMYSFSCTWRWLSQLLPSPALWRNGHPIERSVRIYFKRRNCWEAYMFRSLPIAADTENVTE